MNLFVAFSNVLNVSILMFYNSSETVMLQNNATVWNKYMQQL